MPDNRYYYFKDARGNKHTVDKAAYDNDPDGFAKAFPGARMEVIDRKTGRRGDVGVEDAGKIGSYGANLFTGRTVHVKPKTALGRAAQSVSQEKWGGQAGGDGSYGRNVSNASGGESELVRGLRSADAAQNLQSPVDYAKPGAVKRMVRQERERQDAVGKDVEQAGRKAGDKTMQPYREKRMRDDAPVVDTGNASVNRSVVNTQGQQERQMMASGREIADKYFGAYTGNSILGEFNDATTRGARAEAALQQSSPFGYMAAGKAYNEALDPDKLMKHLSDKASRDLQGLLGKPGMQEEIRHNATKYGISPEEYVNSVLAPGLQSKLAEEFERSEIARNMPKSTAEYILSGVNDSMLGTIASMGMTTKAQRQYAQQAMAMTDEGLNPDVQPGMAARVGRGTLGFVADAPAFGAAGKAGAAVAKGMFGNGVAQAARVANTSLAGRLGRMAAQGAVSQGVTGVLYGAANAAVQNYSTGEDTSIGNTVKLMVKGGVSEGASWATMGAIGGAVGAGMYGVSGWKRVPAKAFQIGMEGIGMHMGGNVAKTIEGENTDWLSLEGNLEACANVVALKLTHAGLPKRMEKDGVKESYMDYVARKVAELTTSDAKRAEYGGMTFTEEEKEQLFGSGHGPERREGIYGYDAKDKPLTRKESLTSWAMRVKRMKSEKKGEESYKDTDVEFVRTAYDEIMADNTIPWDTKAKFSALVMGTVPTARPMMDYTSLGSDARGRFVGEYSKYGELLSKKYYKTADEALSVTYSLAARRENQRLGNAYGAAMVKDEATAEATLKAVGEEYGYTAEQMKKIMDKDPLSRSDEEQAACTALRNAYEGEQFGEGTLHPEQAQTEGKDVVEENGLGTENPNTDAVVGVLADVEAKKKAMEEAMEGNDVLRQEYERMTAAGMSEPEIYMGLMESGLTQEELAPLADYINAQNKAAGMYRGTQQKIAENVQRHVAQWGYKGELNGEKQDGEQMVLVRDGKGRLLIVGAGDVAFDGEGHARDTVGDMLTVMDTATGEMDFVKAKDVTLDHVEKSEDYAKRYQEELEVRNSEGYARGSEDGKVKSEESNDEAGGKNKEVYSRHTTAKQPVEAAGTSQEAAQGDTQASSSMNVPTSSMSKDSENSPKGGEDKQTLTFADGTEVPMTRDSKGRPTADYSKMTAEQGAEWIGSQFGDKAEAVADGKIERAKKAMAKAEKMNVDYSGEEADIMEAEAKRNAAMEAAKNELAMYTEIKKALVEKKVRETMEAGKNDGSDGRNESEGNNGNIAKAREKFEGGEHVVGNGRVRTLPDGSKLRGHYELVEAESLTPSHDANDGYRKSDGFPVNAEGRTVNDRDYEHDKDAQRVTDQIARNYDGQAVDQMPVVTKDGIVVDGNGRTMAGQKAAKDGTDGAYIEALRENAENYGFTAEQIDGMRHPRLVLVADEPMEYDTATFAKFNKSEKKSQGNTQQAVANSKKLGADEVSAIASEIEGSGSLDAFFNNPAAINSLLRRLIDKGVIGLNEVAGLREGESKLSAQGKDFVRNLLLGSVFSEDTIRMMGEDSGLKNKALNGIRAVLDNMKLGDYALRDEIDKAMQLMYEARQMGGGVDALLRTPSMFGENAADKYDPISQAIALALDGKAEDFRELMTAYNRNAAHYADASQTEMFGERPTKEEFVNEFLKLRNWKDYETRHSDKEGAGDAGGSEGGEQEARGGSEESDGEAVEGDKPSESSIGDKPRYASLGLSEPRGLGRNGQEDNGQARSQPSQQEAVKKLATEITRQTGVRVHTDEEESQKALEDAVATDSDVRYHKETDAETLERLEKEPKIKVYRAMQVIDGKLYPPMAAAVDGKLVEANELGTWIRADENPDLAIADIDPKTGKQKVDPKTGELKWKFKLDKGGKDATGKKATNVNAAYNPYWHTSRSPLNDQFKSAWIRPNIVVVECEVPEGELTSGYKAERAKDAVGEVDWKSGSVSGEVFKQTGRARKVILSRWCKPVRVLDDAEVAERAKEFVGEAKVTIPENVLTPRQRVAFEKAGFKIGEPEKGINKSEQIADALKLGLEIDNTVREHRGGRWAGGEVTGMDKLPKESRMNPGELYSEVFQYHGDYIARKLDKVPEDGTMTFFSAHDGKWYFYSVDKDRSINILNAVAASKENYEEFKDKLKEYGFDSSTKAVREDMQEAGYTGRTNSDKLESFIRGGLEESAGLRHGDPGRRPGADGHRDSELADKAGSETLPTGEDGEVRQFRTKDGEVYGFVVGGEIHLDTKKMKPETPLHEYTHLWTSALQRVNPNEWENVKGLLDKVDGLREEVQKLYPELKGDDLYDEMLATYSGREGTKKLEADARRLAAEEGKGLTESVKAKTFVGKVKEALQRYWKGVADMLHIHFTTAEEVADKVLADWARGENPNEKKGEKPVDAEKDNFNQFKEDSPEQGVEDKSRKAMAKFAEKALGLKSAETKDYPSYGAKRTSIEISADKLYASEKKWFSHKNVVAFHDDENRCSYELVPHRDRQGYLKSVSIVKYHGFDGGGEKPTFMPKPVEPRGIIEKAAEDYRKDHPLTDEEISGTNAFDELPEDQRQYCIDAALDYLHGEDTSAISEAYYRKVFEKRDVRKWSEKGEGIREKSNGEDGGENKPSEASLGLSKPVVKRGEKGGSEPKAEPGKQTRKELEAERDAADREFEAFMKELQKKRRGQLNSGFVDQNLIEAAPRLFSLAAKCAYSRIKLGMYDVKEVVKDLRERFKEAFDGFDKKDVETFYSEIMSQRWRDGEQRMSLADWAEHYRKLSPEHKEKLVGDSKSAEERKQMEDTFVSSLKKAMGERKVDGIRELRQLAKELGLEDMKDTDLQELAETAVVSRVRDIAQGKAMSAERKFAEIRKVYENQPSLNQRDSERIAKQQYSTPAPYAYLADVYVTGGGNKPIESALEPSAGNGMLTVGLPMDKVHVNDIDEARLGNLRRQGFKTITSQDGTQPFADKDVDAVVTNPPFGSAAARDYDGYKISSLEGQMAINALDSMRDDGRAAIIIGGNTEYAKNGSLGAKDKALLGYLYSHYNVEDVINVDGGLYAKQGTTYPTRLILINGRREYDAENVVYPPVEKDARADAVKTYEELYKRINDDILRKQEPSVDIHGQERGSGNGTDVHQVPGDTDRENPEGRRLGGRGVRTGVPVGQRLGLGSENAGLGEGRGADPGADNGTGRGDTVRQPGRAVATEPGEGSADGGVRAGRGGHPGGDVDRPDAAARVPGEPAARGVGLKPQGKKQEKRELSTEKVGYTASSQNPFTLQSVIPADQVEMVNKALAKIGDVDQYLVDELGYNDKGDMYKALAAEQADSVALAIYQAKHGKAFIIGDMTGIGKGRQAAAMIRYAYKNKKIPLFITAKKALFSDIYGDLKDIGSGEMRPFIWAAKDKDKTGDIVYDGETIYELPDEKEQKRVTDYLLKNGKLPEGYDYIVTTYDSFTNGTTDYDGGKKKARNGEAKAQSLNGQRKRDLIEAIARNVNVIMDESHKAGGQGQGSAYLQYVVPNLNAVTFLSATYAKRPDNMPIYALRTSMNQSGVDAKNLIEAIQKGGATLQELMSQNLARNGEYIRRERDMSGVTINWRAIEDPAVVEEQREQYDNIIGLFNDIIDFQRSYVTPYIDKRSEELAAMQASMGLKKGTKDLGISNTPFASKTYNMVQQTLLSLKAKEAAKNAIEHLRNGEKVVIALNNTMESAGKEYSFEDEMDAPDLGIVLKKGLEGVLRYEKKDAKDNKETGTLSVEELGPGAVARYNEIMDKIERASTGLSLSPIDVIKKEITDAGYTIGELTGRQTEFVTNENGTVSKVKRTNTDKKRLAYEFNTNKIDALILNRSASTGISLHNSEKFSTVDGKHNARTMIIVQQQADVNEEVQMRGRVDRTGQMTRGMYEYVVSQIPSEQRLLMMFKAKLKSLDANTTSSQKSKFNEMEVQDIINKYGDRICKEYLAEHLELYRHMADPFNWEEHFDEDLESVGPAKLMGYSGGKSGGEAGAAASKALQRMALLKVAEQEKMLEEINERYANEISRLNEMGENDLEITELPLKAKTVEKKVWAEGSEPGGDNAFADNTYIEKANVAVLRKPMKAAEVKAAQDGMLKGKTWAEYKEEKMSAAREYYDEKMDEERQRGEERAVRVATKERDKYVRDAKKRQKESGMSDEQIAANGEAQYKTFYDKEKEKTDKSIQNQRARLEAFERVLGSFNTEEAFVIPEDMSKPGEQSVMGNNYGRLIDIKISSNFSPAASQVTFATLDGRRKITFPVSGKVGGTDVIKTIWNATRQNQGDSKLRVLNMDMDNWDKLTSNESRKDAYILTGNVLQALIDTRKQGVGGQLVKFTREDGSIDVGVLMPDRFKPTDLARETSIASKQKELQDRPEREVRSSDGKVKIKGAFNYRRYEYDYEVRVPGSMKQGGKYYMDKKLRSLVEGRNFEGKTVMKATVAREKLPELLKRLGELGVKVKEESEGTHYRVEEEPMQKDMDDAKGSEELFVSLQNQKGKEYYDTVTELARRVSEGKARIERLGNASERKQPAGNIGTVGYLLGGRIGDMEVFSGNARAQTESGWEKASEWSRWKANAEKVGDATSGERDSAQGVGEDTESFSRKVEELQERTYKSVEEWAAKNGCLYNDAEIKKESLGGKPIGEGCEAIVYRSRDGKRAVKTTHLDGFFANPLIRTLDKAQCFNDVFPESAYTIKGYGRDANDLFSVVMEQPYFEGKTLLEHLGGDYGKANEWLDDYQKKLGFKFDHEDEWGNQIWSNGKYTLLDLNCENVIIDKDGKPHVIDCEVLPVGYEKMNSLKVADIGAKPRYASLGLSKPGRNEREGRNGNDENASRTSARIEATVGKVAKKTGAKVNVVRSADEISDERVRKDIEGGKRVTGWYDEKTGEVHLYLPNIKDSYTAEKTVWHETVGHKGMRGLLGDKFDGYMRGLWMDLDNPVNKELREYVREQMKTNHLGFYDAIEEYIAKSAEDGRGEPGFWNYIRNKVTDALREIGYRVSPNVKDVKYMLWLAKNVQKHGNDPWWKMRAEAVRWRIEHERTEYTKTEGGELYDNDGRSHDFEGMSREEWKEATDGRIHYRTAPSAATALGRYHELLNRHGYMATEAFMDNMASLKSLMEAIDPSIKKIEDVASSMNPYMMQNLTEGKMAMQAERFKEDVMKPLDKAMAGVLDSFDGKTTDERIRNFNLYMIRKHGLERNRVLYVRDYVDKLRRNADTKDDADILQSQWDAEKADLGERLRNGKLTLDNYYEEMDEWIRNNVDADYKAEEHDYSGMHGLQGIADTALPYDDAGAIDEVMSQEKKMEGMRKGSVMDFWNKVKGATNYSVDSDYENGLIGKDVRDRVKGMFDWYVPLRKFDEATAEDTYGYVTELGDPSNRIGDTLMHAKGRESLSNVEILAQIGLMGNRAIRNGGQNQIRMAFARFVRNSGEQNLVKETKVWIEKKGTDVNGNDIWEEASPQIPENASADKINAIVDAFEANMKAKQANGEAKTLSQGTDIGLKFMRARDKSQHFVDVRIAGRTHRFVVMGNPRAAQAVNGMLENGKATFGKLQSVTRWMAMCATSWSPEFVMRNILRDAEFASSNVAAKEGTRYAAKWAANYARLTPLNVVANGGAGALKGMRKRDFVNSNGYGLYARYREGTLGNSKVERYFKEFMENGGETGFVQLHSMMDMEKEYKSIVRQESAKGAKKLVVNTGKVMKALLDNVESLNEVAENMARFATFCTSRDMGRSAARSAYDAKEVSTNFNRHGSGHGLKSFKNGDMGAAKEWRRNLYGGVAGYMRNYSMFFNAGIQSTNLLLGNVKHAPVGTIAKMMATPFALGLLAALVNNWRIANEKKEERGGVKDPYGELPEYIRRNSLCLYLGKGRFATVPLAIELRAFYGLGDLVAGHTVARNVESQRNMAMDAVGCVSQLLPAMDFLNDANFEKSVGNMAGGIGKALLPTATVPALEWAMNSDWKGAPIRRTGDGTELNPAWQNAYSNVPGTLVDINKWVNARFNSIDPGNPEMKGNEWLDMATDPSMANHFFGSYGGGAATFAARAAGGVKKVAGDKKEDVEVGDVPFVRSLLYTPREQSSMARTKAKWYDYKGRMEQAMANIDKLRAKNVPTMKRIENAAAMAKLEGSKEMRMIGIIEDAEKRMRRWKTMKKRWADNKGQVDVANKNIELIMQEAVEKLDGVR